MATDQLPGLHEDDHGIIPHPGGTLYDIETTLLALTEVDPQDLDPQLRAEYERDLQEAIRKAPEKRERVAMKLFDLGQRAVVKRAAALAHKQKAQDLEASAQRFERDADRLKEYVLAVMRELPKPAKGVRTLEGTSATFKAKGVPASLAVDDEAAVPLEYKNTTVTIPTADWFALMDDECSIENLGEFWRDVSKLLKPIHSTDNARVKGALSAGENVPGAHLITDKLRLCVE